MHLDGCGTAEPPLLRFRYPALLGRGGRGVVERQQVVDFGRFVPLRQLSEHMAQPGQWVDATCAASQHQTVDHGAGPGSVGGVGEQPRFSSGRKNSDVAFQNVVIDRHHAVAGVARQIIPLVESVGHGITELGIRHDFRRDVVEPSLQSVQDRQAVLLPETANAIGRRCIGVGLFVSRLLFDPVELLEEPECLFRPSASVLPGFECLDEAPPLSAGLHLPNKHACDWLFSRILCPKHLKCVRENHGKKRPRAPTHRQSAPTAYRLCTRFRRGERHRTLEQLPRQFLFESQTAESSSDFENKI